VSEYGYGECLKVLLGRWGVRWGTEELQERKTTCRSAMIVPVYLLVIALDSVQSKHVSFSTDGRVTEHEHVRHIFPNLRVHDVLPTELLQRIVFFPATSHGLPPSPSPPPLTYGTAFSESGEPDIVLRPGSSLSAIWCGDGLNLRQQVLRHMFHMRLHPRRV